MNHKILVLVISCFCFVSIYGQTTGNDVPFSFYPTNDDHLGPYYAGTYYEDFSYIDSVATSYNVFYEFTIQNKMDVKITNCLQDDGNLSEIALVSSAGTILYRKDGIRKAIIEVQNLAPGKYCVWNFDSSNSNDEYITTTIEGKISASAGNTLQDPIFIGEHDTYFTYSATKNTSSYTNNYTGYSTKDVFHSFKINNKMNVTISHTASFQTKTWLLSENGQLKAQSSGTNNYLTVNTLSPGTYYVVSEGVSTDGAIAISITGTTNAGASSNQNYVRKMVFTVQTPSGQSYYESDNINSIEYYDGLGRPIQTVQMYAAPDRSDITTLIKYDLFGRKSQEWLPVALPRNNGVYVSKETIQKFANTQYEGDKAPYSQTVYENSPLNRVSKQYGPGFDWHDKNKAISTAYLANKGTTGALACMKYKVTGTGVSTKLEKSTHYSDGQLSVTQVTGENGNVLYEFKNKLDQLVLSRQIDNGVNFDTYYVYDDFGNVGYVLPPLAVDSLASFIDTDVIMKKYAYVYKYDKYKHCISKRLPGCDPIYYVYDRADRVILTQDAEQRKTNEWLFTIPDAYGRVVLTGLCKNSTLNYAATDPIGASVVRATYVSARTTLKNSYAITGYSFAEMTILSANFYDNYSFIGITEVPTADTQYNAESGYNTRYTGGYMGLLTGTVNAQLSSSGVGTTYLYSVMYYDNRGRVIQTKSNNHLGGTEKEYVSYDFMGQPLSRKQVHGIPNKNTYTEDYLYTYDLSERLTKITHQVTEITIAGVKNVKPLTTLVQNTYDALGRLQLSKPNGASNLGTTYTYNVRSWIKKINNPHFVENLTYDYGGNIQQQEWTQQGKTRKYTFAYDLLSRLKSASYSGDINFSTNYTYDKQGNATNIVRYGYTGTTTYGIIDNLILTYTGNQLLTVKDTGVVPTLSSSADFRDGATTNKEYSFDLNGNMTEDKNKGITAITYNSLNLPTSLTIGGTQNKYVYSVDGRKLSVSKGTLTTNYIGNVIYEGSTLKRILVDNGYYEDGNYYFYIRDHLGNNRVVANQSATMIQSTQYYPFGMAFADGIEQNKQPYKYNGKELDSDKGLNLYDYSARYVDPALGRFTTMDPLAEKYYSISPYAYCANNPANAIDTDGKLVIFINGMHTGDGGKVDYWNKNGGGFATAVMKHLEEKEGSWLFRDGSKGGAGNYFNNQNPVKRRIYGKEQAGKDIDLIIKMISDKNGNIKETIKIITHSMGAAYAKGYVYELLNLLKARGIPMSVIEFEADFAPYQSAIQYAVVKTYQFSHDEIVAGKEKMPGAIYMDTSSDKKQEHSISSFVDQIKNLPAGQYNVIDGKIVPR